jgi:cell wall-associated NlpC family hydrolase
VSRGKHALPPQRHLPALITALFVSTAAALTLTGPAIAAPAPQHSTAPHPSSTAQRALAAALSQQGTYYRPGGNRPGGFDCSGLVQWSYGRAGITLPHNAAAQSRYGTPVSLAQLQGGDLLFYNYGGGIGHVAMAAGPRTLVEASQSGHPVATRRIYTAHLVAIRRIA